MQKLMVARIVTHTSERVEVVGTSLPLDLACFRTVLRNGILRNARHPLCSLCGRTRSSSLGNHELSWPCKDFRAGSREANIESHSGHGGIGRNPGYSPVCVHGWNSSLGDQHSASHSRTRRNCSSIVHSHRLRHLGRERVQVARLGARCESRERVYLCVCAHQDTRTHTTSNDIYRRFKLRCPHQGTRRRFKSRRRPPICDGEHYSDPSTQRFVLYQALIVALVQRGSSSQGGKIDAMSALFNISFSTAILIIFVILTFSVFSRLAPLEEGFC